MKKILLVTLISSFIIACGGGDGGSASAGNEPQALTKAQIEEKFNLPPEPTADMVGFDTIEGIDSNGIRGRDDVERELSFQHYKDEEKLNHLYSLLEAEKAASIAFQGQNETERKKALKELGLLNMCYIFSYREKGGVDLNKMDDLLDNTPERGWFSLTIKGDSRGSFKKVIEDCKKRGFSNMPL